MHVAGLDVGGSSVKAWLADSSGALVASVSEPLPVQRPAPHRVEMDATAWEAACRSALSSVVAGREVAGITVSTLRQGFVLLDRSGAVLGPGVLNSDRRGAPYASVLAGTHDVTGHWPAPELTLPKLLAVRAEEPSRWGATARVLFLHDWLVHLMTGEQVTEVSYACAGGMADVAARTWATALLSDCGLAPTLFAPVVEPGTVVGRLRPGWGAAEGVPVVAGCGDTQLAAAGAGGLGDGVVTVVAGSSTPVQAATTAPVRDPLGRPWVSTHAAPGTWAAEGNAGYPGTFSGWWSGIADGSSPTSAGVLAVTAAPYWAQETWAAKPPASLLGLRPDTTAGHVARALLEAHAFAVRGNVEDLSRALGREPSAVVVCGGGAAGPLPALVAEVLGRDVHVAGGSAGPAAAGTALVLGAPFPGLPSTVVPAGDPSGHENAYRRWCSAHEALRTTLPEEDA